MAEDFVDGLERLTLLERLVVLQRTLERAIEAGDREELPGEVVAAAAVVAANLPRGASLSWNEDFPDISNWLPQPIGAELSASAMQALNAALPVGGWYWQSWVDDEERREAESVVETLKTTLNHRH